MAVDTEEVQETTAADAAPENSTQDTTATEQVAEATPETPAAQTAETAPEATIPAWDTERQRRDQERAAKEAERIRRMVEEGIEEVLAKKGLTPQQQRDSDELAQAEALEEELRTLRVDYRKALQAADLEAAAAKDEQYDAKLSEAQKLRSSHARRQAAILRQREVEDANKATVSAEWQAFQKNNPDVLIADAQKLADDCYDKARRYASDDAKVRGLADEYFQAGLKELKSKSPAPKPTQQTTKKTATKTGSSTPPGTSVTPNGAGVRPAPEQTGRAANWLTDYFGSGKK